MLSNITLRDRLKCQHHAAHVRAARRHFFITISTSNEHDYWLGELRALFGREPFDALERADSLALHDAIPSSGAGDLPADSQQQGSDLGGLEHYARANLTFCEHTD